MEAFNLEHFFDLSPDLLCIAGYDGYFRKINPAVSKTLGYTEEELFASPVNSFIYPEDRLLTARHREHLLKDVPLLNYENRYVKKNGEVIWLSWTSMPVEAEQLVYAIAKNITHKKRQEHDRNQLIANLTTINSDLKQLTYTTSHDMRSPVNNLLMVFNMLDMSKIQDSETLEFIGVLKLATESLKGTLNTYLDALATKDGLKISNTDVDLGECLDKVVQSLNALVKNSRAEINADFTALPVVKFNQIYMESILLNLVTNSIKYAQPGVSPVINIHSTRVNGISQLTFSDNGLGFDMQKAEGRLFGMHQKFHNHEDGKGIGLYLVYNHVASMGGRIAIDSRVNEGTTFTISFKD